MNNAEGLKEIKRLINEQAEDEGLWFKATTAPEAYLQRCLRELHFACEKLIIIEALTQNEQR